MDKYLDETMSEIDSAEMIKKGEEKICSQTSLQEKEDVNRKADTVAINSTIRRG